MNKTEHPYQPEIENLTPNQRRLLAAYAIAGTIVAAAEATGLSRTNHYVWMRESAYQRAFAEAENEAVERAEAAVRQRAIDDIERPVYFQGRVVGSYKVYSDTLALRYLEAKRPDVWKQHLETTQVMDADLSKWNETQLTQFLNYVKQASANKFPLRPAEIEILRQLAPPQQQIELPAQSVIEPQAVAADERGDSE